MAFNFGKLKAAGIPQPLARVAKIVKEKTPKPVNFDKISVMKDAIAKPVNFSKMTKMAKLPKAPKIALIKRAIKKAAKPKGF